MEHSNKSEMQINPAISATLFKNLREQIEFGWLANSCGFGTTRKGESSFRCIFDEMERLREENEKLKAKLNEEEEEEEHDCCGDCIAFDQVEDYIFGRLKDICREENLDYPQFDAVAITNELGSALRLKRELDALKAVELNEDEDQGFCKVCKKWEPVSKFLEGDVLTQPCKSCFKEEEEEEEEEEDQDDFTNRMCGNEDCKKEFDLADPHYYDEEAGECYCCEECYRADADEMEVYSETDNFGEFCGDHEHLKEFHNCRYYECWGGGSQGGYIVNEKNDVFRVERNWGTPFQVEKVAGVVKEIERDGLKFIRVI